MRYTGPPVYALAFEHVADKSVRGEEVVNLLIQTRVSLPVGGGIHFMPYQEHTEQKNHETCPDFPMVCFEVQTR